MPSKKTLRGLQSQKRALLCKLPGCSNLRGASRQQHPEQIQGCSPGSKFPQCSFTGLRLKPGSKEMKDVQGLQK